MEEFDRSSGFEAGLVRSSGELLTRSALTPDDVRLVDVIRNEDRISEAERRIFIFENSVKNVVRVRKVRETTFREGDGRRRTGQEF